MKKLITSFLLLALPLLANAYDIVVKNEDGVKIYYNYINDGAELEVTSYQKSWYSGTVNIPEEVTYMDKTLKVTSIGDRAFSGCSGLTSVTIPNSVTSIGYSAFSKCSGLISVTIPNSVTSIGSNVFSECSKLTSVTIPSSITSIEQGEFEWCTSLTSVTIPESVTSIGVYAFRDCSGLTSVTIPESVKSIGSSAFFGCSGLTSVTIGNSVTIIGSSAFFGCSGLTSVTIPNSVTTIGEHAFYGCSGLTSITIPNSVTSIGNQAFQNCSSLTSVISLIENPFEIKGKTYDVNTYKTSTFDWAVFNTVTLYVPKGTIDKYKATTGWKDFVKIEEMALPDYTLTYLVDGEEYKSYTVEERDVITPESEPTKEGYTFSGWSELPETMPGHDVTVTGTFIINKYKLTYTIDGEEYKSTEVEFDSAIIPEENPTKDGYTFSGWNEIPETMPANDVTITGTFTANKYILTYTVDGEEYRSAELEYGSTITPEVAPTKEGYTFSGWSKIPSTMPSSDVTITGTFSVNKYTITYMVDNDLLTTEEVEYGSTIAPPKSQKDGYDILWSFYPTTMPAYNITINGTYTTGIDGIAQEESERQVFTLEGKRVETPQKGLNIIRKNDGTTRKVIVK